MQAYMVEVFAERWEDCGILLANRATFSSKVEATKYITKEKRRRAKTTYRIELWQIETRRLTHDRLAELVVTEDIWNYLIHRKEQVLFHEKRT